MSVTVGMKAKAEAVVNDQNTAITAGSGTLPVFATPWMCALMEQAAQTSLSLFERGRKLGGHPPVHRPPVCYPRGPEGLG